MEVKKDILWRVSLCFLGIVALSLFIIGKAFYIQQVQGEYWKGMSDSLHLSYRTLDADRGTIYSEDGSMLSTSIPFFDIHIDFMADGLREKEGKRFTTNLDSLSIGLSKIFQDQSAAAYKKQLQAGYKKKDRYYLLKKKVSFQQYQALRTLPLVRQGRNKSGFIVEDMEKRLTPFGLLANRTIGLARTYVDNNRQVVTQNVGLEKTYDSLLKGVSGKRLVRRISGGAYVPVEGSEIEPENGKDIVTTLDVNIQDITQTALMRMMTDNQALEGTAIVMEVATGKIKAIANLGLMPDGSYFEKDNYALKTSEPGSTIKLVTLMSVLEDKYVTLNDMIDIDGGVWMLNGRRIQDAEKSPKSHLTIKESFEHSSNVAMAKLAYTYYSKSPAKFVQHYENLHLTSRTGVDLKEEFRPMVKNPKRKDWHMQTLPSMGFGYEVMLSPLQILMIYNAVANNGKLMKPYLVNKVEKDGNVLTAFEPQVLNEKICAEQTLHQLQECLAAVCIDGTAKRVFKTAVYHAAGKTGTAKVNDGNFKYTDGVYQSSFAGYFPVEKPKYSCIVVIKNKPRSAQYLGGSVAAPVFREIADKLYAGDIEDMPVYIAKTATDSIKYKWSGYSSDTKNILKEMNIPFIDSAAKEEWGYVYNDNNTPGIKALAVNENQVPDVKGMGLKDALFLLENMNLKVQVKGKGKIINQSLAAGQTIGKGQTIMLELD
ncbi:MAG: transpeptidase family protein [Terrimonas sp.]|nr:transpeptidase family protein [Terrimonas sp.]OJY99124.1 MAG: peptidoglycan glycosyltransferase [Sphingobacteriales bacterium 40-81]